MHVSELCQLLLNTDQFEIESLVVEEHEIRVGVESTVQSATCPKCQQESTALHSHYPMKEEVMAPDWKNPILKVKAPKVVLDPLEPISIQDV